MDTMMLEVVQKRSAREGLLAQLQVQLNRVHADDLPLDLGCLLATYQRAGAYFEVDKELTALVARLRQHADVRKDALLYTDCFVLEHMMGCVQALKHSA